MSFMRVRKARKDVLLAAKCVESGYEPNCEYLVDPDDLIDLIDAVRSLRNLEA
jgi:hypothetical protein